MQFRQTLAHDPISGITDIHHYDSVTDKTVIQTVQDAQPVIDAMKKLQNDSDNHFKDTIRKNGVGHAAKIPMVVLAEWMKEGITIFGPGVHEKENQRRLQEKLNTECQAFKTTTHRVNIV